MTETPAERPAQEIPPAFQQNGHSTSQLVLALMQQMPQLLAGALASVLQQVPVRTSAQFRCTGCVMNRIGWVTAHQKDADAANGAFMQAVMEQSGLADDDPRKSVPLDFTQFLPEALRPGAHPQGMPPIQDGTVMLNGALWCVEHVPGAPGKPQILVAHAGLTPAMLSSMIA